jgi:hypothetical protein
MRTLPHWGQLLPLLGATLAYYFGLGWLRTQRATANLGECGQVPTLKRGPYEGHLYHELPVEEWCPAHDCWYGPETECAGCRDEWEQTWTLGEEPAERDAWSDSEEERWAATENYRDKELSDGWYLDLLKRAEFPTDPHSDWRDA